MISKIMSSVLEEMENSASRFEDDKIELSPYEYVREFRTIHLDYGRRTGKTTYINSHAGENDFILIPKLTWSFLYPDKNIGTENILSNANTPTFNTIYVDEPKLHNKLDACLKKLIKNHEQTIIMLGA